MVAQNVFHTGFSHQIRDLWRFADRYNIPWNLPTNFQTWLQQYSRGAFLYYAHCSFGNPICFWSVWCRRAMIPGKIFTSFAKFKGIVFVNDFRLPIWLQELLQAPFCFLWAQPGRSGSRKVRTEKHWETVTVESWLSHTTKKVAANRDAAPKEKYLLDTQPYQKRTVRNAKLKQWNRDVQRWLASRVTASIQKHCITPSKNFNHPGINSSQSSMMNTRRTVELDVIGFLLCLRRIKNTTGHKQQCTQKTRVGPQRWNASQRDGYPIVRQRLVERCVLLVRNIPDSQLYRLMTLPQSSPLFTLKSVANNVDIRSKRTIWKVRLPPLVVGWFVRHVCTTGKEAVFKQHGRGRTSTYSPSAPNSYWR